MSAEQEYIPRDDHQPANVTRDPVNTADPMEVVNFTQRERLRIYDETHDTKDKLRVLNDLDNTALISRKLNIEENVATDGRKVMAAYDHFRSMLGGADPLAVGGGGSIEPVARERDPAAGLSLPTAELAPGEDHQGAQTLNVADYVAPDE